MKFLEDKKERKAGDSLEDQLFKDRPDELKKIRENQDFIREAVDNPVSDEVANIPVFGTTANINDMIRDDARDVTVKLIEMVTDGYHGMTLEQLQKLQKKRRKAPFGLGWLFILLMFLGFGVFVLILGLGV